MQMKVYVLNQDGEPLMPCPPAVARLLLKDDRAKVVSRTPFTIKLLYQATDYTQPLTLGVDTGSSKLGAAVVNDQNGEVVYMSEVELRNDITGKMEQRRMYRRNRRNRKTRYRKPRFLNRKNSIKSGRFPPTVQSKINAHIREIQFVKSIMPISHIILETGTFDPHALKNPAVLKNKWLYQRGTNFGYANTKAYVLHRDGYACQHCKGKSGSRKLEVHHIEFRSDCGSNNESNLIVLCDVCHKALHNGNMILKKNGERKGNLAHATQMNVIRSQLLQATQAEETFGYITKEIRQWMDLPKTHFYDAVAIASQAAEVFFGTQRVLMKKCVAKGDRQQTKGVRSEKRMSTGKIGGFRKFDKVLYGGQQYFIKGRMSTGYAILMGIDGQKVPLKPIPKFERMIRLSARSSWIIREQTTASFC